MTSVPVAGAAAPMVAVRGEVTRDVFPEIAHLGVTVSARDGDRQRTLTRLAQRSEDLRTALDRYGDAIERRESSRLVIWPETRRSGERVRTYNGSLTTTVTIADFTVLGELVLRLADQEMTSVSGPWWSLRPGSQAYRDARRDAIEDAVRRAREYAGAVGARLTRLIEITDVGMGAQPVPRMMTLAAGAPQGGPPQLILDPQLQTVHVQVEARFEMSEPSVLDEPAG